METTHLTTRSALTTAANHFAIVGGRIHAFTDEDACWRFIHGQREAFKIGPMTFLDAHYATRRELAAA